jgi:hypothetical protein
MDPLHHMKLVLKTEDNVEFINGKLTQFLDGKYPCEWTEDFLESSVGDDRFVYLLDKDHLYGVISLDGVDVVDGNLYVFSQNSCTFERIQIPGHPELTSGRVLRAFKLVDNILTCQGRPFVYWGNVIRDATNYNRAMGLVPFKDTGIPLTPKLLRYIQRNIPGYTEEELLNFDMKNENNAMFFPITAEMMERLPERLTAYHVIQHLLPPSTKLSGKSKKRKRKRATKRNYHT